MLLNNRPHILARRSNGLGFAYFDAAFCLHLRLEYLNSSANTTGHIIYAHTRTRLGSLSYHVPQFITTFYGVFYSLSFGATVDASVYHAGFCSAGSKTPDPKKSPDRKCTESLTNSNYSEEKTTAPPCYGYYGCLARKSVGTHNNFLVK